MTYELTYGTLTIGRFDGRWRRDTYVTHCGAVFSEPALATGPDDKSNRHNGMSATCGGNYDPACSACWLGACHTEAYHAASVANKGK